MANEQSVSRKGPKYYIDHKCSVAVASTTADQDLFIATSAVQIVSVRFSFVTGSTSGTLALRKITDTSAPGAAAGATVLELLTTALDLSTAVVANTVTSGVLTSTISKRIFKPGDRLSADFGGTLTSLANCLIQIELQPLAKYGSS